ncbi:helix-turn-helix domain-containing protein [Patescibacteria group bacterium]|nr:helix-turn-helix domain-containing protein [Patescibacteria group bacterium]
MVNNRQNGGIEGKSDIKESAVDRFVRIGKLLQDAREQRGKNCVEVAKIMGIAPNRLLLIESGLSQRDMPPGHDILKSFAEALGDPDLYDEFCRKLDL